MFKRYKKIFIYTMIIISNISLSPANSENAIHTVSNQDLAMRLQAQEEAIRNLQVALDTLIQVTSEQAHDIKKATTLYQQNINQIRQKSAQAQQAAQQKELEDLLQHEEIQQLLELVFTKPKIGDLTGNYTPDEMIENLTKTNETLKNYIKTSPLVSLTTILGCDIAFKYILPIVLQNVLHQTAGHATNQLFDGLNFITHDIFNVSELSASRQESKMQHDFETKYPKSAAALKEYKKTWQSLSADIRAEQVKNIALSNPVSALSSTDLPHADDDLAKIILSSIHRPTHPTSHHRTPEEPARRSGSFGRQNTPEID